MNNQTAKQKVGATILVAAIGSEPEAVEDWQINRDNSRRGKLR